MYLQTMDCVYDVSCVCKSRRPMTALHLGHVHPSFWWRIEHCPTLPKFLVPEKSGTRMHGTRAKLLVPVSGTRNSGGELGSCAMGLRGLLLGPRCIYWLQKLGRAFTITYGQWQTVQNMLGRTAEQLRSVVWQTLSVGGAVSSST